MTQSKEVSYSRLTRKELFELIVKGFRYNHYESKVIKDLPEKSLIDIAMPILRSKGMSFTAIANKLGITRRKVTYFFTGK